MVYNDDRDYDNEGILSDDAEEAIRESSIDWEEIKKEKYPDFNTPDIFIANFGAWTLETIMEQLNRLIGRLHKTGNTIIHIKNRSILFRYRFRVFYSPVVIYKVPHPKQNAVVRTDEQMRKIVGLEKTTIIVDEKTASNFPSYE